MQFHTLKKRFNPCKCFQEHSYKSILADQTASGEAAKDKLDLFLATGTHTQSFLVKETAGDAWCFYTCKSILNWTFVCMYVCGMLIMYLTSWNQIYSACSLISRYIH